MIWPFKKKSKADAVLEVMDAAISFAADKWKYYTQALVFREDVGLRQQIGTFLIPATEDLRNNFATLRDAPDAIHLIIVAKGIELSGTHSQAEIEDALGVPLPD